MEVVKNIIRLLTLEDIRQQSEYRRAYSTGPTETTEVPIDIPVVLGDEVTDSLSPGILEELQESNQAGSFWVHVWKARRWDGTRGYWVRQVWCAARGYSAEFRYEGFWRHLPSPGEGVVAKEATTYLMSTSIVPAGYEGRVKVRDLTVNEARLILKRGFTSAVGHTATAEVLQELLGLEVRANRLTVTVRPGDRFVCFQLHKRPPEGAILDRDQLEAVGYSLRLMEFE